MVGTRLKINQIAELTGYADSKYMSRVFKKRQGCSRRNSGRQLIKKIDLFKEFHPFILDKYGIIASNYIIAKRGEMNNERNEDYI